MGCMVAWLTPRCAKCPSEGLWGHQGSMTESAGSRRGKLDRSKDLSAASLNICERLPGGLGSWETESRAGPCVRAKPQGRGLPPGTSNGSHPLLLHTHTPAWAGRRPGLLHAPDPFLSHAGKHTSMGGNGSDFIMETRMCYNLPLFFFKPSPSKCWSTDS